MTKRASNHLPPATVFQEPPWEQEARQYEPVGAPGVHYEAHVISFRRPDGSLIHCRSLTLLHRAPSGDLRGILNFFPDGPAGIEKPGNLLIMVHPDFRGFGFGTQLLAEADARWNVNFRQQTYTPEGRRLAASYLRRRGQRVPSLKSVAPPS